MPTARRTIVASCLIGVSAAFVAGCSDDGSTTPTTKATTTSTTKPKVWDVVVDLMITGDRTAVVNGTQGTCSIPRFGAPRYEFSGESYPDLGPAGTVSVVGPLTVANSGTVPANVGVVINDAGFSSPIENDEGITLSANKQVVTLDVAVGGGPGQSIDTSISNPTDTLHARVTGTIRCT